MKMIRFTLCIAIASLLCGCQTHVRLNHAERLIQREDFVWAKVASPEWCRDALKTINALELELERR